MLARTFTSRLADKEEFLREMHEETRSFLRRKPRQGKTEPREDEMP
jgi:hypothetical protein